MQRRRVFGSDDDFDDDRLDVKVQPTESRIEVSDITYSRIQDEKSQNKSAINKQSQAFKKRKRDTSSEKSSSDEQQKKKGKKVVQESDEEEVSFDKSSFKIGGNKSKKLPVKKDQNKSEMPADVSNVSSFLGAQPKKLASQKQRRYDEDQDSDEFQVHQNNDLEENNSDSSNYDQKSYFKQQQQNKQVSPPLKKQPSLKKKDTFKKQTSFKREEEPQQEPIRRRLSEKQPQKIAKRDDSDDDKSHKSKNKKQPQIKKKRKPSTSESEESKSETDQEDIVVKIRDKSPYENKNKRGPSPKSRQPSPPPPQSLKQKKADSEKKNKMIKSPEFAPQFNFYNNHQDNDDEQGDDTDRHDQSSQVSEIQEDQYPKKYKQQIKNQKQNQKEIELVQKNKKPAKGFSKQKAIEQHKQDEEDDEQILDTNPENHLIEKKKSRKSIKTDHFFSFDVHDDDSDNYDSLSYKTKKLTEEEGIDVNELECLNDYFLLMKGKKNFNKKRKKIARHMRKRNYFFTSKWFMLFFLVQNLLFWLTALIFPMVGVIGCNGGHKWMSHVTMAIYMGLILIFDVIFAMQYTEKQSGKFELKAYKKGIYDRSGKCFHMILVYIEVIFEIVMTQISLFDIYTDIAFATIVQKESMLSLLGASTFSLVVIAIPKIYGYSLAIAILFGCIKEEDRKRKYVFRMLTFAELRVQAMNVEYIHYEKNKIDVLMAFFKFLFEDLPQFATQVYFLTQTDCGMKNENTIIYVGISCAVLNTYFGLLYRFSAYCYSLRRLNSFKRKIEIPITNNQLAEFGFRHIRDKVKQNKKTQALTLSGSHFEYMMVNEKNIKKYAKLMDTVPRKEKLEFVNIDRLKFESLRQVKQIFTSIDNNFKELRYLTIQQCLLSNNFILQLKAFLDGNDSLARFSFVMNRMPEDQCYEALQTCLDHPNLEIIQLADIPGKDKVSFEEEQKKQKGKQKGKKNNQRHHDDSSSSNSQIASNKAKIYKEIFVAFQQSGSLKKLEIRFLPLHKRVIQALFRGLSKNNSLQLLLLTHNSIKLASALEFQLLGDALRQNHTLVGIDLSLNENLDDNLAFHEEITDSLISNSHSKVHKIWITTESYEVKSHYLELIDQKPQINVFVANKVLEDVDIQE